MKVFGIGLTRTGTTSLTSALNTLGISAIHYPSDARTQRQLLEGDFGFDCLREYDAATDITTAKYYPQLDRIYRGSKFVLTIRDIDSWLQACRRHWEHRIVDHNCVSFHTLMDMTVYGCARFNEDRFRFVYAQHLREVRNYFQDRPDDLLEFDIVGGAEWEPLCIFLRREIPDEPFPHLHRGRRTRNVSV